MNRDEFYSSLYLAHHGVKGQKWGHRRYQNEDGSYKSGAEGRYDPDPSGENKSSGNGASSAGSSKPAIKFNNTPYGRKMQKHLDKARDSSDIKGVKKEYRKSARKWAGNVALAAASSLALVAVGKATINNAKLGSYGKAAIGAAATAGIIMKGRKRMERAIANAAIASEARSTIKADKAAKKEARQNEIQNRR